MALYYAHNVTCDGSNIHSKFTFQNNLWKIKPNLPQLNFSSDFENNTLVGSLPLSAMPTLTPGPSSPEFVQSAPISAYITEDYYHNPRFGNSNVGAIEYGSFNSINEGTVKAKIYPNPGANTISLERMSTAPTLLTLTSLDGVLIATLSTNTSTTLIDISTFPPGIYLISFPVDGTIEHHRFVKL
jgi:hypothetical protein